MSEEAWYIGYDRGFDEGLQAGAAVAFGLIGMALAIRNRFGLEETCPACGKWYYPAEPACSCVLVRAASRGGTAVSDILPLALLAIDDAEAAKVFDDAVLEGRIVVYFSRYIADSVGDGGVLWVQAQFEECVFVRGFTAVVIDGAVRYEVPDNIERQLAPLAVATTLLFRDWDTTMWPVVRSALQRSAPKT